MFVPRACVCVCARVFTSVFTGEQGRKKKQSERGYKRRDRVEVGLRRRDGGGEDEEC